MFRERIAPTPNTQYPALTMDTDVTKPPLGLLLRVWLALGLQSFGGGVATLALIRQAVVERHRWMPEAEFAREWTLVQAAPGINLLAMTILIGRRLAGWRGIAICMIGLLLPSVTVTILLTAGYAHIQRLSLMRAALRGIVPATVGLGALTAYQMARSPLMAARREGKFSFLAYSGILLASMLAALRWRSSVIVILGVAGMAGALAHRLRQNAPQIGQIENQPVAESEEPSRDASIPTNVPASSTQEEPAP